MAWRLKEYTLSRMRLDIKRGDGTGLKLAARDTLRTRRMPVALSAKPPRQLF